MKLKKWLSLFLITALIFTMVPGSGVTAFATELSHTSEAAKNADASAPASSEGEEKPNSSSDDADTGSEDKDAI